ncbi:uncharacterized protein EAE97_010393 [Botrytis byssoidea]|uniref:Uncharacterized protein n=1 Tax=Botrytis byssoidea TaxID=139641 RepID=A0A9P5I0I7_9HELO|nr:uncharacterized protein EAE97_010393 [Botrytis byssoidea]KAF7926093.1 hypothetical protein EAE97_010393 [Botrytis byssoidea]
MDQVSKTCSENPTPLQLNTSLENGDAVMQQIFVKSATQKSIKDITFIHENFKSLLLTTPAPSLVFRYGPSGAAVTFHSLNYAQIDSKGKIMISHLWKCTSGSLQVDDSFIFEKPEELRFIEVNEGAPMNRRRISLLGSDKEELSVERIKCDITVALNCLVMFTTHDGFSKNLIDGRGLTKFEATMSVPLRSDEDYMAAEVIQAKDLDIEQDTVVFDSASQSTVREIAEQKRSLKGKDLVLPDLQGSEKIAMVHLEAMLWDAFRGLEEKLISLAKTTFYAAHPSPLTGKKDSLTQITSLETANEGIENFEVSKAKLADCDKALESYGLDISTREIALDRFQPTTEKRE